MKPLTSYTRALTQPEAQALERYLRSQPFVFGDVPHARFAAEKGRLKVVFYRSGKLVLQGKDTQEFVEFVLEPQILKRAELGYEAVLNPGLLDPRLGVDESGKGDFFGPLCVAGVYVNAAILKRWEGEGVRDSKSISSTPRVRELARLIQETPGCVCEVIAIGNEAYNRLHHRMGTVNAILAWGHAQAIENLLRQKARMDPPPVKAISDQFAASKGTLARALKSLGRGIQLVQRHRAEEDLAVAAASILARNECLVRIAALEKKFGMSLPRGASASVDAAAEAFVGRYGAGELGQVAKLHFRNALVYRLLGDGAPARTASLSASAGGGPSEPDKNR